MPAIPFAPRLQSGRRNRSGTGAVAAAPLLGATTPQAPRNTLDPDQQLGQVAEEEGWRVANLTKDATVSATVGSRRGGRRVRVLTDNATTMPATRRWDVVCRVVDNYGDAGVAWRLARQLAGECGKAVTLWIDDPAPLARMVPGVDPAGDTELDGVRVRRGPDPAAEWVAPDVVVEAFGTGLPARWIDAMAGAVRPPAWIVLEYLSAETWVDDAHLRSSPEPRTGLVRHYWCPGFTPSAGGLLREAGLLANRDAFLRDRSRRGTTLDALGVGAAAGTRVVLVFCYPSPALADLFDAWADDDTPTVALVPAGVAVDALDRYTGGRLPTPGHPFARGALNIASIPFVPQRGFDPLLWSCDRAIVRGEDSFVRAQWALVPFGWQAYAQDGAAHLTKVDAFLDRYLAGAPPDAAHAVRAFHGALNRADGPALVAAWPAFDRAATPLAPHRRAWSERLAARADLAGSLTEYVDNLL